MQNDEASEEPPQRIVIYRASGVLGERIADRLNEVPLCLAGEVLLLDTLKEVATICAVRRPFQD